MIGDHDNTAIENAYREMRKDKNLYKQPETKEEQEQNRPDPMDRYVRALGGKVVPKEKD